MPWSREIKSIKRGKSQMVKDTTTMCDVWRTEGSITCFSANNFQPARFLVTHDHYVEGYVQDQENPPATELLVFKDYLKIYAHLMIKYAKVNAGKHCRWSSEKSR